MSKNKVEEKNGVTASLSFGERLVLLQLLPQEGTLVTMRLVRELREGLAANEAEMKLIEVVDAEKGTISWGNVKEKKLTFSGFGLKLIIERLEAVEKEGKLAERHLTLWDKFIAPAQAA